jgi:hypothetical protein
MTEFLNHAGVSRKADEQMILNYVKAQNPRQFKDIIASITAALSELPYICADEECRNNLNFLRDMQTNCHRLCLKVG